MISYFTLAYKKYAEFNGRSTRSEFWYFYLYYSLIGLILWGLSTFVSDSLSVLSLIFGLGTLIPYLAITVRRLHDVGKSGWNYFWILLPIIGWIYFLVLLCTKSQEGGNTYGPNPWGQSTEIPAQSEEHQTPQNPTI